MRWFNLLSRSDAAAATDDCDVTIVNGAARDRGSRSDGAMPGTLERPDPPLSEEIKQRQVALIQRYIVALRAR